MYFILRSGLSFCISVDRVILLDHAIGRYFALPPHFHKSFSRWATGAQPADDELDWLGKLVNEGILIATSQRPHPGVTKSASLPPPDMKLDARHCHPPLTSIVAAILSRLLWLWRAKHWPFARMIGRLGELADHADRGPSRRDNGKLAHITRSFEYADLIVGSHDRCLSRSLALAAACRKRGLPTTLVIGVQADPFAAHCWVQDGSTVLNEKSDRAKMFLPIMVA
ncbi:lasso peptide biosynthesis B2 protein [Sphingobium sp. YR768]|uniref:lasso peptide biosynthesis B2 protein n=1 Tax=Sphingobium sp. YR768 TaxID=1884365 RepID=UPI0008B5DF95|nr:lasso peptide biosynthesis B2 protein [Sphingobium sp. YR768]SER14451.1 Transglutaminase-like superfamily protein [Sphingobium sp. YR768]